MHAAVVTDFAAPPIFGEFAEPEPAEGEVLVTMRAAAVSNLVRLVAAGKHYSSAAKPPMVAGVDGVGELADGSLVYVPGVRSPWGTLAERAVVASAAIRPIPAGLAATQAAAIVNAAFASWLPLDDSLEENLRRVGADGVDVVLDFLWGDTAAVALPTLARVAPHPQYRIDWVNLGALDGVHIPLDSTMLRMADLHVWGSGAGAYSAERRRDLQDAALDLAARGVIEVDIHTHPLADIGSTWGDKGRLVFEP